MIELPHDIIWKRWAMGMLLADKKGQLRYRIFIMTGLAVLLLWTGSRLMGNRDGPAEAPPHAVLNFSGDVGKSGLSLLDRDVSKNDLILAGEGHAIQANTELQLQLIRYLHEKAGIRYIALEMGYSGASLFNEYLSTGDEALLEQLMSATKGTAHWNRSQADFWQDLHAYNQSLPDGEKLRLVGVDVEHSLGHSSMYLAKLLKRQDLPAAVKADMDRVNELGRSGSGSYGPGEEIGRFLLEATDRNKEVYRTLLGEELDGFRLMANNMIRVSEFKKAKDPEAFRIRENAMYQSFVQQMGRLPEGKVFGQFGGDHILQHERSAGREPLASMLSHRTDSPFRGKVLSIPYEYENCRRMDPKSGQSVPVLSQVTDSTLREQLQLVPGNGPVLFRLSYPGSPYERTPAHLNGTDQGATTDYIQYLLLIRNSEAALPYGTPGES
ncbi:erythromycin esterase family protein [Gorillibacterium sp. sgz5001074]|uniref:erythromycin esterase family protein n=1 Tax=Gorillibacterium sp. sgz5001074 TaxID=3446695 RepID=UPI003F663CD7